MGADWRDTTSVYGPGFTLGSEAVALAAGESDAGASWAFRGIATASMVALTVLAAFLARRRAFAAAFVGWNPLLAVHFAGGGHNDALMMALVLGALALAAAGRRQLAGVAWVASIAIKWIPAVFLVLRALEARATGRPVRHLGFALAAAAVVAVASWRYGWGWLESFGPLARNLEKQAVYSIPHRLSGLGISEHAAALLVGGLAASPSSGCWWRPGEDEHGSVWRQGSCWSRRRGSSPGTRSGPSLSRRSRRIGSHGASP